MPGIPPKQGDLRIGKQPENHKSSAFPIFKRRLLSVLPDSPTVLSARGQNGESLGRAVPALVVTEGERLRVIVALATDDPLAEAIQTTGNFAVSILPGDWDTNHDLRLQAADTKRTHSYRFGATGLPLVNGAAAHLECSVVNECTPVEKLMVFVGKLDDGIHWGEQHADWSLPGDGQERR